MNYPSRIVEEAVDEFSKLPGIGRRTALRLVLHLLKQDPQVAGKFGETLLRLRNEVRYCGECHGLSETDRCTICSDQSRMRHTICVVEDIRDVMAIENTGHYRGIYHVLGGIISPIDGIGPGDLNIESLVEKVTAGQVTEVIMAISATMEGDTTVFYLYKRLKDTGVTVSTIARGVSVGDELEYTDEATLARSIINRVPYQHSLAR